MTSVEKARDGLRQVLYDHGIPANKIAAAAKIHENSLYRFLANQQELSLEKWLRIVEQLPEPVREEYLAMVFRLPKLEGLSTKAKKRLFVQLAAEFAESAISSKVKV
jgi:hypothetical protein